MHLGDLADRPKAFAWPGRKAVLAKAVLVNYHVIPFSITSRLAVDSRASYEKPLLDTHSISPPLLHCALCVRHAHVSQQSVCISPLDILASSLMTWWLSLLTYSLLKLSTNDASLEKV